MSNHVPDNIKELITKALIGQISEKENELLELWYNKALPQEVEWKGEEKNADQLKSKLFGQIKENLSFNKPTVEMPFYKSLFFRVAASLVLFAFAGYYLANRNDFLTEQFVLAQDNGVRKVILPDSTIVWLKGKSTLSYSANFSDSVRAVSLDGEALFEVMKDKNHPFVVKTGNYTTRVLGTSFNLNTRDKKYKLIVLTGKVQVGELDPKDNKQKILAVVLPNQQFARIEQHAGEVTAPAEKDKEIVTKGTEYPMYFDHTPFAAIMERIERKFSVSFAKADYAVYASCKITADLTDQSLKNSLEILAATIGAQYKIENQTIMIEGGGCR